MTEPFGIAFFSSRHDLEVIGEFGHGKYQVVAPKPHPEFETYIVQATDNLGVVWIKGLSRAIENDAYGTSVRSNKDRIHAQLTSRYGQGRSVDQLFPGAIWTEPRDWIMALTQNERQCFVIWEPSHLSALPGNLSSIYLGVGGLGGDTAQLVIEYASSKMSEAESEIEKSLADLL